MSAPARKTPLPVILCAWVVVAVPLGWGLYQSVVKARPLFTAASPEQSAAAAPASASAVAPASSAGPSK